MERRSTGLKDYFVVRRRPRAAVEEDGKSSRQALRSPVHKSTLSQPSADHSPLPHPKTGRTTSTTLRPPTGHSPIPCPSAGRSPSSHPSVSHSPQAQSPICRSPVRQAKSRDIVASSPSKRSRDGKALSTDGEPKLERFNFIEFDSPTKKEKRSQAAGAGNLPLPKSYQCLAEQFRCADVIVDMLRRRQEICTFSKLKKAVEEMSSKSFTVKTLAQIKTVYPRSLVFFYDRNIPRASSGRSSRQQLVIEANMEERALDFSSTPASKGSHFTSASFIHRRRVFQRGLLARLKQHHRAFLASLDPPLEIPERDVLRWHEDFDLDSVADVEESEMPQPPVKEVPVSAKQLLLTHVMSPKVKSPASQAKSPASQVKSPASQAKSSESGQDTSLSSSRGTGAESNQRASAAEVQEKEVAQEKKALVATPTKSPARGTPEKHRMSKESSHLKGVSRKLIEKIQEKEAARARLEIMRKPEEVKELHMLDTSMKIVPILKTYFLLEKKAAVPLHCVVAKVQESYSSQLSPGFVEETMQYLVKSGISWIQIVAIKSKKYVKVDKSADVNVVLRKIENLKKKHVSAST